MRQDHGAAHHLVCMFGINAQTQSDLNRLVKLGEFHFLKKRHGFSERILAMFNRSPRLSDVFSCFSAHYASLSPTASGRKLRAVVLTMNCEPQGLKPKILLEL